MLSEVFVTTRLDLIMMYEESLLHRLDKVFLIIFRKQGAKNKQKIRYNRGFYPKGQSITEKVNCIPTGIPMGIW